MEAIFSGEMNFSLRTEHYQALSLSFPCEIFFFKPVFGGCSYAVSKFNAITIIRADKEKFHICFEHKWDIQGLL